MQSGATSRLQNSREIADFFRVSVRTVLAWHRQGKLPAVRIGRELRFRQSDVDALINAHLESTSGEAA